MLNLEDIRERIKRCLGLKLRLEATNPDTSSSANTLRKLAKSDDEYIRAFAIRVLAGGNTDHIPEDFTLIQNALKDKSSEVRRNMIDAVIALAKVAIRKNDQHSIRLSRRFLSQLASDPSYEVRNELISHLHKLTETDHSLCFEYLERFTNNVDVGCGGRLCDNWISLSKNIPVSRYGYSWRWCKTPMSGFAKSADAVCPLL